MNYKLPTYILTRARRLASQLFRISMIRISPAPELDPEIWGHFSLQKVLLIRQTLVVTKNQSYLPSTWHHFKLWSLAKNLMFSPNKPNIFALLPISANDTTIHCQSGQKPWSQHWLLFSPMSSHQPIILALPSKWVDLTIALPLSLPLLLL